MFLKTLWACFSNSKGDLYFSQEKSQEIQISKKKENSIHNAAHWSSPLLAVGVTSSSSCNWKRVTLFMICEVKRFCTVSVSNSHVKCVFKELNSTLLYETQQLVYSKYLEIQINRGFRVWFTILSITVSMIFIAKSLQGCLMISVR